MDEDRSRPMSSSRTPDSSALGSGRTSADRACLRPQTTVSPTPAGTFRAAGCDPLQTGTAHAFGDRIPVPDGVERPRPHKDVPARDDMSPDARSAPARAVGLDHECAPSHQPPGSPHLRRPAHPLPNNHGPASGTNKRPRTSGAGPAGVAAPVQARCSFSGGECSCHPSGTPNPERGHRTSSFGGILLPDPPS